MNITLTTCCPVSLFRTGNEFAAVLTGNPADFLTYRNPTHQDAEGNLFCVASAQVSPTFVPGVMEPVPLEDPGFPYVEEDGTETPINLPACEAMRAGIVQYTGQEDFTVPTDALTISFAGIPAGLMRIPDAD